MLPIQTLFDSDQPRDQPCLPAGLLKLYDGDLIFPPGPLQRPYVFGNFVSTLDGVISYRIPAHSGGSSISGSDNGDRFIMGLLRASADAVLVGAGTVKDVSPRHLWIPSFPFPEAKDLYRQYRVAVLHKPEQPLVAIVSGRGSVDLDRAVFNTTGMQVVLITSDGGRRALLKAGAAKRASVQVKAVQAQGHVISPEAVLNLLFTEFGARSVLHEGGPTLFGHFVAHNLVDELYLTLAPQIAGRFTPAVRPGMVQGVGFRPESAPWWRLVSSKRGGDHLYLRYRK
jgi:riboflavin biosynthesis pyrimidine reductase